MAAATDMDFDQFGAFCKASDIVIAVFAKHPYGFSSSVYRVDS